MCLQFVWLTMLTCYLQVCVKEEGLTAKKSVLYLVISRSPYLLRWYSRVICTSPDRWMECSLVIVNSPFLLQRHAIVANVYTILMLISKSLECFLSPKQQQIFLYRKLIWDSKYKTIYHAYLWDNYWQLIQNHLSCISLGQLLKHILWNHLLQP